MSGEAGLEPSTKINKEEETSQSCLRHIAESRRQRRLRALWGPGQGLCGDVGRVCRCIYQAADCSPGASLSLLPSLLTLDLGGNRRAPRHVLGRAPQSLRSAQKSNGDRREVAANTMVVMIWGFLNVSNQYLLCLRLTQSCTNGTSTTLENTCLQSVIQSQHRRHGLQPP